MKTLWPKYLVFCLVLFRSYPTISAQAPFPSARPDPAQALITSNCSDTVLAGNRSYGPFLVQYTVTCSGYLVNCRISLGDVLVGLGTMTSDAPFYQFNTISNKLKAWGKFTTELYPSDQVSTLEGDLFIIKSTADTIRFKGTVNGWYTKSSTTPKKNAK